MRKRQLLFLLLILTKISFAQKDTSGYKFGNSIFVKNIAHAIMHKFPEFDSTYCIVATIEINRAGKIENLHLATFKDTTLTTLFLMKL